MSWCAHVKDMPHERPCIMLLLQPPLDEKIAEIIGTGCEEENIPLAWDRAQDTNETAHAVALRSRLDVGIVAAEGRAFVSVVQLPDHNWLDAEIKGPEDWRWIGQVAARLVKGQPLPPKPEEIRAQREAAKNKNKMAAAPVSPAVADSPVLAPDAGLYPIEAPYLKERENNFETLVSLVTEKIMEQLREKGSGAVG